MEKGTFLRFNAIKGYGFIKQDNGDNEVFVHFSEIKTDSYKKLKEGQRVSYELKKGERGEFAANVVSSL